MPWHARLDLNYRHDDAQRTVLQYAHTGPLRIFKSLYPEGGGICHNVVIHPPGGLVGGDTLEINARVAPGAHALLSTPGATRFYRGDGLPATQSVTLTLAENARLEWVPLETIAYPGCLAQNRLTATLGEGAEWLGWDVCALGLPAAGQAFDSGSLTQHIEIPGLWLERSRIDAADTRLLESPLGLNGQRCIGTLWLACGTAFTRERREHLLDAVREVLTTDAHGLAVAAPCPNPHLLVVRAMAPLAEPLMALFQRAWATLRAQAWGLSSVPPRIWNV